MEKKKSIGFGARGWILIVVLFISFMTFQVFTNFPLNILADFYGGSQQVAMLLTIGTLIGIVLQIVISSFVGKIKSIKKVTAVIGAVALVMAVCVSAIPRTNLGLWSACYLVVNVVVTMYALFFLSIIAGQWFPTRKGTVMGIATIAYPFTNGVIGFFAGSVMNLGPDTEMFMGAMMAPAGTFPDEVVAAANGAFSSSVLSGFLPFLIAAAVGYILFLLFVTDYPEQCGAYRDNDKSMTPEIARKMMAEEIENKRTTVWKIGHIFMNRDFWFAAVTCGLILMGAIGIMTQSQNIIGQFPELDYTIIMMVIAVFGAIGSWLLGVLDTKFGTRQSMLIATVLVIISGVLGLVAVGTGVGVFLVVALVMVAMFMGASSNYTVSVAAQYWRREDFSPVFACVNPVANIFNALAPTVVAGLLFSGNIEAGLNVSAVFIFLAVIGVIGTVLMFLFSAKHVKETDDKYRKAAGKPLDNALAGRR